MKEPFLPPSEPEPVIMQFFDYDHLPVYLQVPSKPCHDLARRMIEDVPDNSQRDLGLTLLLMAKDAFVRAALE
jgi:hypothetical protein